MVSFLKQLLEVAAETNSSNASKEENLLFCSVRVRNEQLLLRNELAKLDVVEIEKLNAIKIRSSILLILNNGERYFMIIAELLYVPDADTVPLGYSTLVQ